MGGVGQHPSGSVVVSWAEEPEEWLWPLVVAVHESASLCSPPRSKGEPSRPAVVRISIAAPGPEENAKTRRLPAILQDVGMSRTSHEEAKLNYVADDSVLRFSPEPLLQTRFGSWLHEKGWLQRACFALFVFLLALVNKPACRVEHVPDAVHGDVLALRVRSIYSTVLTLLVQLGFFSLVFQRMNRYIFIKTFWSFECLMLIGNFLLMEAAGMYHMLNALSTIGALKVVDIVACSIYLGTSAWWGVWVATVDAWMISRRQKALFVGLASAVVLYSWVDFFFIRRWSSASMCLYGSCVKPKHVAVAACGNLFMFMGKLVWAYVSRWPFANLKTYYVEPRYLLPLRGDASKTGRQVFSPSGCCPSRSGPKSLQRKPSDSDESSISAQTWPHTCVSSIAQKGKIEGISGETGETLWTSGIWASTSDTPVSAAIQGGETEWQSSASGGDLVLEPWPSSASGGPSTCPTSEPQGHDELKGAADIATIVSSGPISPVPYHDEAYRPIDMSVNTSSCPTTPSRSSDEWKRAAGMTPGPGESLWDL